MTPRADGLAVENSASRARFNPNLKKPKVTRGAKQSASDKPIFSKEEGYLDRAVARRAAEQRETKLAARGDTDAALSPLRDEASDSIFRTSEHESFELESVRRDGSKSGDRELSLDQHNDSLLPKPTVPPSPTDPASLCNTEMGARLASVIGASVNKLKTETSSQPVVMDKFLSGRMSYEFDLDNPNQSSPSTVMHGRHKRESHSTGGLPPDLLNMVISTFAPKAASGGDIKVPESFGDDIFPDAGEYTPNAAAETAKLSETPERVAATIFKDPQRSAGLPVSNLIPESIRNLTTGPVVDFKDQFTVLDPTMATDDYDECYPGVYESASILPEDDDGHPPTRSDKPVTKRQLAAKDRQKLDKQLGRVTKILESRHRGKDREK